MDATGHVDELRRAGHRLADAVDGHLDAPVPSCPDWTVADLLTHLGQVQGFWTAVAAGRATDFDDYDWSDVPGPDELVDWFRAGVDASASTLGSIDPATERWNWSGSDQTAGWIIRRMGHETAVHAWDGIAAVGPPEPIPAAMAVDGVDEFLDVFARLRSAGYEAPGSTLHLHATDADGEWFISTAPDVLVVDHVHAKGDVAVRGSASDLVLMLWQRCDPGQLELHGDRSVLDRFVAANQI